MKMLVQRTFKPECTLGVMTIGGAHECFTLELPYKDGMPGSCIPAGVYQVVLTESDEFGQDEKFIALCDSLGVPVLIPRIIGIPNRTLIDLHWGNRVANTRGCILAGETEDTVTDFLGASRPAFAKLYPKIVSAVNSEGCSIEIRDPRTEDSVWPNS
jgi:hypothetical protein